jgi:hypothetical protein
MLLSHLCSIGEFRLLDFNYTLPLIEVITKTPNPKCVPGAEALSASSADSGSSGTDPVNRAPVMSVPQFYYVLHWESAELVDSFSPELDKLSSAKTVPFHLLNQQLILMFARLLDRSLHHPLTYPAGADPHDTTRNVYMDIRKHFEAQEWIKKEIFNEKWNAISVCTSPEATYNELLTVNAECANIGVGHTDQ